MAVDKQESLWQMIARERVERGQSMIDNRAQTGWCKNRAHPAYDHWITETCVEPVTDAENTAKLFAETLENDARCTVIYPTGERTLSGHYVAEHRPY